MASVLVGQRAHIYANVGKAITTRTVNPLSMESSSKVSKDSSTLVPRVNALL